MIVIPYLALVEFILPGLVEIGNEFSVVMPYDGEILGYQGSIAVLGAGAGTSTAIQLENDVTGNYFTNNPNFSVDSATKLLEGGTIIDSPVFRAGNILRAFITGEATTPGEDAIFSILCKFYKRLLTG